MIINGKKYKEGDLITIDGGEGLVYEGVLPLVDANP